MGPFRLEGVSGKGARAGILRFPSGLEVRTPLFMPVATKMCVRTLDPDELRLTGTEAVITNGFLSSLEPGSGTIRSSGGMHRIMGWEGGIFSDSGGFQLIRKGFDARISEEGVSLRSPFNGERVMIGPEDVVDMHFSHGVDVGMVLDHCPPYPSGRDAVEDSANRTVYWARRSALRAHDPETEELLPEGRPPPLLFGITQGGIFKDIRKRCTRKLVDIDLPGYGIGGLSIGESKDDTFRALEASTSILPEDRPRYFMGVGDPDDVIRSVLAGVDVFDSVFPTRNARHGSLFIPGSRINIRNRKWKGSSEPIMQGCSCATCRRFTMGYLHHLFRAGEVLGPRLATIHNLHFMQDLIKELRSMIIDDGLNDIVSVSSLFE